LMRSILGRQRAERSGEKCPSISGAAKFLDARGREFPRAQNEH
jgi:hypothetical protein